MKKLIKILVFIGIPLIIIVCWGIANNGEDGLLDDKLANIIAKYFGIYAGAVAVYIIARTE